MLDTFKPAPDGPAAGKSAAPAPAAAPDDSRYGKGFIFSVGIDDQFSPFTYKTDGGGYAGFDVEMCEKVAQINGWNLMTLPVEWNSIVSWLDSRRIDCIWSGFTMSDSMKQKGYVSSFAYYDSTVVLLTRADSFIMKPEDLMGCRVERSIRLPQRVRMTTSHLASRFALAVAKRSLQTWTSATGACTTLRATAREGLRRHPAKCPMRPSKSPS